MGKLLFKGILMRSGFFKDKEKGLVERLERTDFLLLDRITGVLTPTSEIYIIISRRFRETLLDTLTPHPPWVEMDEGGS